MLQSLTFRGFRIGFGIGFGIGFQIQKMILSKTVLLRAVEGVRARRPDIKMISAATEADRPQHFDPEQHRSESRPKKCWRDWWRPCSVSLMTDHKGFMQLLNLTERTQLRTSCFKSLLLATGTHSMATKIGSAKMKWIVRRSDGASPVAALEAINPKSWSPASCALGHWQKLVRFFNVCFFLSPFVFQAKYPKISSFMREGKIQEASSALGSARPTLMQLWKHNTSAKSCAMPCCHSKMPLETKAWRHLLWPRIFSAARQTSLCRAPCKSLPVPILQPTFRQRHGEVAHRKWALLGCKPTWRHTGAHGERWGGTSAFRQRPDQ